MNTGFSILIIPAIIIDCILKLAKKVNHVKAISPGHSPGGGALSIRYVRNAGITQGDWVSFLGNPPVADAPNASSCGFLHKVTVGTDSAFLLHSLSIFC